MFDRTAGRLSLLAKAFPEESEMRPNRSDQEIAVYFSTGKAISLHNQVLKRQFC